jgi:hypothetical protein
LVVLSSWSRFDTSTRSMAPSHSGEPAARSFSDGAAAAANAGWKPMRSSSCATSPTSERLQRHQRAGGRRVGAAHVLQRRLARQRRALRQHRHQARRRHRLRRRAGARLQAAVQPAARRRAVVVALAHNHRERRRRAAPRQLADGGDQQLPDSLSQFSMSSNSSTMRCLRR